MMGIRGGWMDGSGGVSDQFGYVLGYVLKGTKRGLWKLKELERGYEWTGIMGGCGGTSDQFGYILGYVLKGAKRGLWKIKRVGKGAKDGYNGWMCVCVCVCVVSDMY